MDCSPARSSVCGILQARTLEWVAIPFSRGSSWSRDQTWVFCISSGFFIIWATRGGTTKKKKKIRAKQCKTESWIAWYDEAENINRSIEGSVMSWHYLVFRKYLLKETYILSIDKEEPVVCLLNYSCRSYHKPHHDSLGLSSPKEVSYSLPTSQFCCPWDLFTTKGPPREWLDICKWLKFNSSKNPSTRAYVPCERMFLSQPPFGRLSFDTGNPVTLP